MGVPYEDTIERMRWAGKCKNDSEVARQLEMTPQAISNYKKRGELPSDLVIRFAELHGLSLDWLIKGDGDAPKIDGLYALEGGKAEPPKVTGFVVLTSPDEGAAVLAVVTALRGGEEPEIMPAEKGERTGLRRSAPHTRARRAGF